MATGKKAKRDFSLGRPTALQQQSRKKKRQPARFEMALGWDGRLVEEAKRETTLGERPPKCEWGVREVLVAGRGDLHFQSRSRNRVDRMEAVL